MIQYEKVYDISIHLGVESVSWPGDPPYERRLCASLAEGGVADVSLLTMTAHTGTHVDTPAHFLADGRRLDDYAPGDFILPARVVDAADAEAIGPEAVGDDVPPGGAVLFRTANSTSGRIAAGRFFDDGVHLSLGAARRCLELGARLVGIDYFTVDACGSESFPVHRAVLGAGVLVLETIDLRAVPAGEYTLICLPLRMHGAEGSPVRAVLLQ